MNVVYSGIPQIAEIMTKEKWSNFWRAAEVADQFMVTHFEDYSGDLDIKFVASMGGGKEQIAYCNIEGYENDDGGTIEKPNVLIGLDFFTKYATHYDNPEWRQSKTEPYLLTSTQMMATFFVEELHHSLYDQRQGDPKIINQETALPYEQRPCEIAAEFEAVRVFIAEEYGMIDQSLFNNGIKR